MRARTTPAARLAAFTALALLVACDTEAPRAAYNGYVEGIYVSLAPREPGRIVAMPLVRGQRVEKGDVVLRMEDDDAAAGLAAARAELARAKAQLADLSRGRRPEEIAVTRAQLGEAEARLVEARRQFDRQKELFERKTVSPAALDQARAAFDAARARVESLKRQIEVEQLGGREQALEAARRAVAAQKAQREQAEWRLAQRTVHAPAGGTIEEVLRREGELAGPDAPAATLLPDANSVVRFFVPQTARADLSPGQRVSLSCDGCAGDLMAEISFIANEAEYTPPVIYSIDSRQKLVYLVEARPLGEASDLRPGQIVGVTPRERAR